MVNSILILFYFSKIIFKFGEQHESELWKEFQNNLTGSDLSKCLYHSESEDRPDNLGYHIGYKITESFYLNSKNKKAAVSKILNIKDFNSFLKSSKYADKFN